MRVIMKISKIFSIACVCLLALGAIHANLHALPPDALPQPEFEKKNFLLTSDTEDHPFDRECDWIWGNADDEDWANPGHQY